MKRKGSGKMVTVVLSLVLAGVLVGGTGAAFAGSLPKGDRTGAQLDAISGEPVSQTVKADPPPQEVIDKANTAWDNHIQVLALRLQCAQTEDEIRHKVQELRAAGVQIPEETRQAVKDCRDSIRTSQDAIRATVGPMESERNALHEDRLVRDWEGVSGHLDSIIALQETRIAEGENILGQLQTILELLDQVG